MSPSLLHRSREAGQTMIGLLVVIAIIMTLAVVYLFPGGNKKGNPNEPQSTPARAINKAESFECQNNLRQIRMTIQSETMTGEPAPSSLKALNYPAESLRCPVGKEPYKYNPKTGHVRCPHPGHEKY